MAEPLEGVGNCLFQYPLANLKGPSFRLGELTPEWVPLRSGVNTRGAPCPQEAAQGIARHMEGGGCVNTRGAPSQQLVARGIAWHMEGGGVANMRGAPSQQ